MAVTPTCSRGEAFRSARSAGAVTPNPTAAGWFELESAAQVAADPRPRAPMASRWEKRTATQRAALMVVALKMARSQQRRSEPPSPSPRGESTAAGEGVPHHPCPPSSDQRRSTEGPQTTRRPSSAARSISRRLARCSGEEARRRTRQGGRPLGSPLESLLESPLGSPLARPVQRGSRLQLAAAHCAPPTAAPRSRWPRHGRRLAR